jgi:hypothetical protein
MNSDRENDADAMIQFGGEWLPACDARERIDTANAAIDAIDRFNNAFPRLATASTREVVPLVRQRLSGIKLRLRYPGELQDLAQLASDLLHSLSPEHVLESLAERRGEQLDITQLIQLTGEQPYLLALRREAAELDQNRVSPEQTAQLWNELARPAPGGGRWNARQVIALQPGRADAADAAQPSR